MRSGTYNIAVGIDFSDSSAGAMYHALALAERLGPRCIWCTSRRCREPVGADRSGAECASRV